MHMKVYNRIRAVPSVTNVVRAYVFVLLFVCLFVVVFKHSSLSCPFSALIEKKGATSALCYSQLH